MVGATDTSSRHWSPASPVFQCLTLGSLGQTVGPFVLDYETERRHSWTETLWWYLVVVGVELELCSMEVLPCIRDGPAGRVPVADCEAVVVSMRAACRTLDGMLTSAVGRRQPPTSRSGRDVGLCRVPNRSAFLSKVGRTELSKLYSARGGCCGGFARRFGVLEWFSACSLREDVEWSGGDVVLWLDCVFFVKNTSPVGYPRFCVSQARVFVVLGVCPGVVLVGLHCSLACACRAAVGPFVRDCETERRHSCTETLWWYLVVVGVEVELCSVEIVCQSCYLMCGFRYIEVRGTASVTHGTDFHLVSDKGDMFKGFKRGVYPGCDFDQSVKSFISARQSKGCSVQRKGDAVKLLR
ncbi:hypothetical protein Taro_040755 [Colocasia esculenta]|uniref:Uncharacterized protein n=1 Tax=Colocasia esculenta TaxID=4460 RepID=A0A843WMT5_COLES|nr:hypothetical protein [Colocasia esculenta]